MKEIHSVDSRIRTACCRAGLCAWRSIIRLNDAKRRNVAQMLPTRYEPVHTIVVARRESDGRMVAKRRDRLQHVASMKASISASSAGPTKPPQRPQSADRCLAPLFLE
jgi:hypothetical protein